MSLAVSLSASARLWYSLIRRDVMAELDFLFSLVPPVLHRLSVETGISTVTAAQLSVDCNLSTIMTCTMLCDCSDPNLFMTETDYANQNATGTQVTAQHMTDV